MSRFQYYIHKDTYDTGSRIEITDYMSRGTLRNIRYEAYDKDFTAKIANNTLKIRDEDDINPIDARTWLIYFRDNTITYVDIYYNSQKIYTGYIMRESLKRTWSEGTFWTDFTVAHVMKSLDDKQVNFYTTELGAFEDLTDMILTELPATQYIYKIDTLKDEDGNTVIPPYKDYDEDLILADTEFAGEYAAGSVDTDLIPSTGYLQIGRETTAYTGFTTTDNPYTDDKIIIFTVDRTSPYAGSREYWDQDDFMVLEVDSTYIDFIDEYNIDLAADDSAKNFYWSKNPYDFNYITQMDYDEAGNETTIPHVVGYRKLQVSTPSIGYTMYTTWFNDMLEDDMELGYYAPGSGSRLVYDYDVRPVFGNWFSSSGHSSFNFA